MIEEEVYTEALFAKLDEERKTGTLLPLGKDFYTEIEKKIKEQEKEDGKEVETQNKKTTLNKLKSKRTQKILVYLAYNKPLPAQVPAEEEALYYQILKTINKVIEWGQFFVSLYRETACSLSTTTSFLPQSHLNSASKAESKGSITFCSE